MNKDEYIIEVAENSYFYFFPGSVRAKNFPQKRLNKLSKSVDFYY